MLRRAAVLLGAAVLVMVGLGTAPAFADQVVVCDPVNPTACTVVVVTPGGGGGGGDGGGGGGGGGGPMVCRAPDDTVVNCFEEGRGWYDPTAACWWRLIEPQPVAGDPKWKGKAAPDYTMYHGTCPYSTSWFGRDIDEPLGGPPPGFGGLPSPVVLAARAVSQLPIKGPQIQTAPDVNGAGLVGLNVWLSTVVGPETWGPQTATASVPGLSVTATAKATKIEWRMGDGQSVVCANPGTAYSPSYGGNPSPTCGYIYRQSSRDQPGGKYTITAVTTWHVTWVGGGQTGALDVTRQSTSSIRIDELQVVTR